MKKLNCIVAADLHGNKEHYKKLYDAVNKHKAVCVFLCGDLLPKDGGLWHIENKKRTIDTQRVFIKDFLKKFLTDLSQQAHVYAIYGNDDFRSTYTEFSGIESSVTFLDNEVVPFFDEGTGVHIAGYPYVPLTPFLQKDWEKWDNTTKGMQNKVYRTDGYISTGNIHKPIDLTDKLLKKTTIKEDMKNLREVSDPRKTIYLMHAPPYNTPLDMVSSDNPFLKNKNRHVGSEAIRDFVDKYNPLLTMHGHIHESMQESGEYVWYSGKSISVNPSHNFKNESLAYLLFDLPEIHKIKRLLI